MVLLEIWFLKFGIFPSPPVASLLKPIPLAAHGDDVRGRARFVFDFLTQPGDVDIDGVRRFLPHLREDFFAGCEMQIASGRGSIHRLAFALPATCWPRRIRDGV